MNAATLLIAGLIGQSSSSVGDEVLAYARSQLGQTVGDGACTSLISEAVRHAGAERRRGGEWGEPVGSLKDVRPGDILTFEGTTFVRKRLLPNGGVVTLKANMGRHAAIVSGVKKARGSPVLSILHQNIRDVDTGEERKVVTEWVINLSELRGGKVRAYRPIARE
jgi:hypothetical protein